MSEVLTSHSAAIGPGRLILVVGPSGAGKDTLLDLARTACADDGNIRFVRRQVTREASSFEDNEQMSPDAFQAAVEHGDFAVHWEAHGHRYGLSRAIDDDIRKGRTVVANVSRAVIDSMRHDYCNVLVVLITAPPDVLKRRLVTRARQSDGAPEQRLSRVVEGGEPDQTLLNVGCADFHARELVKIIRGKSG